VSARVDWPAFVVMSLDGRYLQERAVVRGFLWETSGVAWVRDPTRATKFPSARIAAQDAVEVGGASAQVAVTAYRPRS